MTEVLKSPELGDRTFLDTIVTIGVFDGVHEGHLMVIEKLKEMKEISGSGTSIILTFDRHPLSVTHPDSSPPLLTTLDEKVSLLKEMDIDVILVDDFTTEIARMSYSEFMSERLINSLGMKHLVIGYDFHRGRGREGNRELLAGEGKKLGFGVSIVPPVVVRGSAISSTRIRRHIFEKKLRRAARLLTRPYFFDAVVVRGTGIGHALDFPTANVSVSCAGKLIPPRGVYAVRVGVEGGVYDGMMNIGIAPTVKPDRKESIEIHLLDYSGQLYGKLMRIYCLEYIRDEKKFGGRTELQAQLKKDRDEITRILEKKC